jgi:hypothetical protein
MSWAWRRRLNAQASQPTIAAAEDGGFVAAWEQEPDNHLRILYYRSLEDLLGGAPSKDYEAGRTLSSCAEGTPNIYAATSTRVEIGFHYYWNCDVDRQAIGILTDFNSWSAMALPAYDAALLPWGVGGNIGDRDYIRFQGRDFDLIEGQLVKGDFGSWRVFLYEHHTGEAAQLDIATHRGSRNFANPTVTEVNIDGERALVVTLFVPHERAAPGEAGSLIYYRTY